MAWPLRILAVGAVGVGIVLGPTHLFANFLERKWIEPQFPHLLSAETHRHELDHDDHQHADRGRGHQPVVSDLRQAAL